MTTLPDVLAVLAAIEEHQARDNVFWNVDLETASASACVLCNDFFWWACADAEDLTASRIDAWDQAHADVAAIDNTSGAEYRWGPLLFCARMRQMRPQGCCYPQEAAIAALFDACGPKRDVDLGNPYQHPADGGDYAYKRETS